MALISACAATLWRTQTAAVADEPARSPSTPGPSREQGRVPPSVGGRECRLRWLALSLVPSSLLLGVTTYISSEITPMPFLWVVPLSLYLLTFILVFARRTLLPLRWMVGLQPVLVVMAAATLMYNGAGLREVVLLGTLHLAAFFVTAMVCHAQLAAERPEPSQLTEFYLWMSLGGVVGGLLTALVAPVIFNRCSSIR